MYIYIYIYIYIYTCTCTCTCIYIIYFLIFPKQANQLYYDSVNGTYYTYNTETQQYEIYCRVELPTDENEDNDNGHVIQAEPMSLKSRVLKESKLYLELIQELGKSI